MTLSWQMLWDTGITQEAFNDKEVQDIHKCGKT
jgi:hypothetical protein